MFEKVRDLISQQLNIEKSKIIADAKLIEDLGIDSLDMVTMLMTLEDEFGITIPDEKAETLKTVGDVVLYIESLK